MPERGDSEQRDPFKDGTPKIRRTPQHQVKEPENTGPYDDNS